LISQLEINEWNVTKLPQVNGYRRFGIMLTFIGRTNQPGDAEIDHEFLCSDVWRLQVPQFTIDIQQDITAGNTGPIQLLLEWQQSSI
jgi:hypothetical protein